MNSMLPHSATLTHHQFLFIVAPCLMPESGKQPVVVNTIVFEHIFETSDERLIQKYSEWKINEKVSVDNTVGSCHVVDVNIGHGPMKVWLNGRTSTVDVEDCTCHASLIMEKNKTLVRDAIRTYFALPIGAFLYKSGWRVTGTGLFVLHSGGEKTPLSREFIPSDWERLLD